VPFPDKDQAKALGAHWQSTGVALPIVASARIPLYVLYDEAYPED
jgi:hypothetical protein